MTDIRKRLEDAIPDITGKSYYWGKLAREAHDELAALRAERDAFYIDYRDKCDAEAKVQAVTIEALRARVAEAAEILRWSRHYTIELRPGIDAWFERVNEQPSESAGDAQDGGK